MTPPAPALQKVHESDCTQAAYAYVEMGIPIAPFDPTKGKGKSCWNLVGSYDNLAHAKSDVSAMVNAYGEFRAVATSPGAFGALVIDVDVPALVPTQLRGYLKAESVPYVNTRPNIKRKGHYWFWCPKPLANRSFEWGELRSVGGGIVLPPYQGRVLVRGGQLPPMPTRLLELLEAGAGGVRGSISLEDFCAKYTQNNRPHKLRGLVKLHKKLLQTHSPHVAMLKTARDGMAEARIGYVPAAQVVSVLQNQWDRPKPELRRILQWCATVADESDLEVLKAKSDRSAGTDSRQYAGYFAGKTAG